jgi:hypothetical protein
MDLGEIWWEGVEWMYLAQDRNQNMVINLWVMWKAGNIFTSWMTISFLRRTLLHGVSLLIIQTQYHILSTLVHSNKSRIAQLVQWLSYGW